MYIYNLTAVIDESVFEAWQQWLAHSYLPAVNASALVDNVQIMRVLDSTDRHYAIHHEIGSAANLSAFLYSFLGYTRFFVFYVTAQKHILMSVAIFSLYIF